MACDIDTCSDAGKNHLSGYPDCLDLCDTHYRDCVRDEDEFDRVQRLAGCRHGAAPPEVTP